MTMVKLIQTPPSQLSENHVKNIRRKLKGTLVTLLKHPASAEFHEQVGHTALTPPTFCPPDTMFSRPVWVLAGTAFWELVPLVTHARSLSVACYVFASLHPAHSRVRGARGPVYDDQRV